MAIRQNPQKEEEGRLPKALDNQDQRCGQNEGAQLQQLDERPEEGENRKVLAELALNDPDAFDRVVELAHKEL